MTHDDQSLDEKRRKLAQLKLMKERLEAELAQEEATPSEPQLAAASVPEPQSTLEVTDTVKTGAKRGKRLPQAKRPPQAKSTAESPTGAPKTAPQKTPTTPAKSPQKVQPVASEAVSITTEAPGSRPEKKSAAKTKGKTQPAASPAHRSDKQLDDASPTQPRRTTGKPRRSGKPDPVTATNQSAAAADDPTDEPSHDEESKPSWRPLRGAPPWLLSLIVHMAALIVLALATIANLPKKEKVFSLATLDDSSESIEEISEIALEQMEIEEVEELAIETQMPDPGQIEFGEVAAAEPMQVSTVGTLSMADTVGDIGALFGSEGKGMSELGDGMYAAVNFFGTKSNGRRFVFVVDNSNSMGRGKYETALDEMLKSVNVLSPKQQFYVIFFSDTAYRMFHPQPAERAVPATPEYKEKLRIWLYNTQMCLRTKGLEAMQAALALRPDVIYILGDGAFTDDTAKFLTAPHQRRVVINTFGMEVNDKGRKELQRIAKANDGTYKAVRTTPAMVQFAKQNPIKKNNTRGKVWGLKLPVAKKK